MTEFDPLSDSFAQNPYPTYRALREQSVPVFSEAVGAWLVARFEDVDRLARDATMVRAMDVFMSPQQVAEQRRQANWHDMPNHARFVQFSLLDSDGEVHDRLRRLVLREFSKQFIARHRSMIQAFVDKLLVQLIDQREFDFVRDFAQLVPGHIIGKILGVPDEDCAQLRVWSEDVVQFFDVQRTDADKQKAERATTEFYQYLTGLLEQRREHPQEDLLSTLLRAQAAKEINETELISTCMLILMAGHGSTIDVLSTGMNALLTYPAQMRLLRDEPGYMDTAVQEMFRFESPLPFFHRYASHPTELFGLSYPQGTRFGLLYGAANRDERQFANPDEFIITRKPNRHLAFGRGAHLCLGNNLARLDMSVIFTSLLDRTADIEICGEAPIYKPGLSTRGLDALHLRITPA